MPVDEQDPVTRNVSIGVQKRSAINRPAKQPELDNLKLAASNVRMTQAKIIQDTELTPEEVSSVVDLYEQNLEELARTADAYGIPLVLMSVASNWEWRGREDLPDDYLQELVGIEGLERSELQERALQNLNKRLQDPAAPDRHELLFRRATLLREMGRIDAARADYRASMNSDPHLRRALDRMATRVRKVATGHNAHFVDSIEILSSHAEYGIVGFKHFYDYVHFRPEGAVVLAAALYEELQSLGILPGVDTGFRPQDYVREELSRIANMGQDDYDVETWLGIGFDRANLIDRNLWKYEEMAAALDQLIQREPDNVAALVYRGNLWYHQTDGAAAAAAYYRAGLELESDNAAIQANLTRLLRDRSPGAQRR